MSLLSRLFGRSAEPAETRAEPVLMAETLPQVRNAIPVSDGHIFDVFGMEPTATGRRVTEDSAMRVSAVYACVRLISGAISSLPVDVYRREADGKRQKINEKDDIWWLLNEQPHARWTGANFWKHVIRAELLRGDGCAEILRAGARPVGLKPIIGYPDIRLKDDRLVYVFTDEAGNRRALDQDDVLHFPGFGFNGIRGMSAISWGARNGIGIALATDEFSGKFFGAGALVKHALTSDKVLTPAMVDQLRAQWEERYSGLDNAYKPLVLTEGLGIKELSLSAEDSQLLEARKFQVIDIARAFGVPPILIGESEKTSSWGSGVEQIVLAFVKFALADRLQMMEQEVNRKLFRTSGRFVKFNVDEILRGDAKARGDFLRQLVGGSQGPGIITTNEARATEGLSPLPDGDALYDPRTATAGTGADKNAQQTATAGQ